MTRRDLTEFLLARWSQRITHENDLAGCWTTRHFGHWWRASNHWIKTSKNLRLFIEPFGNAKVYFHWSQVGGDDKRDSDQKMIECQNVRSLRLSEVGTIGRELRYASIRQRSVDVSSKVWRPMHHFKWCLTLLTLAFHRPPECGDAGDRMFCHAVLSVASRLRKLRSRIALACVVGQFDVVKCGSVIEIYGCR